VLREYPDPEHVREVIIQTHLFAGYPRALNGLDAYDQACEKIGLDRKRLRAEPLEPIIDQAAIIKRGQALWASVYGSNADRIANKAKALSPDLAHWSML